MKRNIKFLQETLEVNGDTGEVVKYQKNMVSKVASEPPFIKIYLDYVMYINDMPKKHSGLLMHLIEYMSYAQADVDYGGHVIYVNAHMKRIIADKLNITLGSLNNALTELVKSEVLYRVASGTYQVSPFIIGKGRWEDIERLQFSLTFDASGRTARTEIKQKSSEQKKLENQEQLSLLGSVIEGTIE